MQKVRSLRPLVSKCFLAVPPTLHYLQPQGADACLAATNRPKYSVWNFGDGSHGALGLPLLVGSDVYEPTRVPHLPSDVRAVCTGHYHSLAVTSAGEVWAWGRNDEGQLGRAQVLDSRDEWSRPGRVQGLDHVRVRNAFASGVVSMAVGEDGSLWAWGRSQRGQLGLGRGIIKARLPTKVEALAGEEVAKLGRVSSEVQLLQTIDLEYRPSAVSCGLGHSLALCLCPSSAIADATSCLFSWGWNLTCRGGKEDMPAVVEALKGNKIKSACGGRVHSVAVTSQEEWGSGRNGRLGLGSSSDEPEPTIIESLQGLEVLEAVCGHDHNLVLVAE